MSTRHIVLFSGGLDSTAVLFNVIKQIDTASNDSIEAVGFDYGQRHSKELAAAEQICEVADVMFNVIEIPRELVAGQMLTSAKPLPQTSYDELPAGMSPTYVPFRNGLMISMAAAAAQNWVMRDPNERKARVYIGSHAEDAARDAYPDCSVEFMQSMARAVDVGTYGMVKLIKPLIAMKKAEVIKYGEAAGAPWAQTWSCYAGADLHCGTCPTCRARQDGFKAAGITDPTEYAKQAA